jgi:SAM-dependent methyltransferase
VLKDNGERFMPDWKGDTELEHLHRYQLALDYVGGKRVLDVASGEGYGSAMLATRAAHVVGVDLSPEAVLHAAEQYRRPNLEFREGSATSLPLPAGSVDVVVSFETLEHLAGHEEMLTEIARVLRGDGLLILSTPDKLYYTDQRHHANPFHVKELYREEFRTLVQRHFPNVELHFQRATHASIIVPEEPTSKRGTSYTRDDFEKRLVIEEGEITPLYLIAFASRGALPATAGPSTYQTNPPAFGVIEQELRTKLAALEREHQQAISALERTMRDAVIAERDLRRTAVELWELRRWLQQAAEQGEKSGLGALLNGARDLLAKGRGGAR